jgi:acyl-CoA reductase-like NAD-dependent aldehyde dehydrogenase
MLKVLNPANGTVIQELKSDTSASVSEKFKQAARAQKEWARTPLSTKLEAIQKFRALVVERKDKLAAIMTKEVGKPISQSKNELNGLLNRVDFFLSETEKTLAVETVLSDAAQRMDEKIVHEPLGVIANISAWNYPYFVGSNVFVPALLAGNSVLYKPSELAALTGLAIAELLHESGIPEHVFIPVIGGGDVGSELLKQPIAAVFFTGSYATGQKIAEAAAKRLIKVQLELGGKDPVYIAEDVHVKGAAEATADGAFYNTGQSCCSVERIYVHQKIYDAFLDAFLATVKGFAIGDPSDEKTYIGPLTRSQQIAFLEKQVKDAVQKGAKLLTGGHRVGKTGNYFEPTVLANVNHSMDVMREESFGPVIGIQKVTSDEEAIHLMNDTEYGLTAGVYTNDRGRADRMLAQLNAGSAYWNCCDRVSPRLPWSGRGHSGIGCTLSRYGILAFTQPKAYHLRSPA